MFNLYLRVCLSPGLRLFEREAIPVDTRTAKAAVGARFTIQYAVTAQADQDSTRLILQGAKELVVAVFAIAYNKG